MGGRMTFRERVRRFWTRHVAAPAPASLEAWERWERHRDGCAWCADRGNVWCAVGQSLYGQAVERMLSNERKGAA